MERALDLARNGLGNTWPNPAVGCVLVAADAVVGEGWTRPGGRPHAETEALSAAGARARGATAYVTLEPCAHRGQTGPCAVALAEAGVARVVVALHDPDPRVSGRGLEILRKAGIAVETGLHGERAARLNAGFLHRLRSGRPRLTLKLASTLDGRIALANGQSRWITGPQARGFVHGLRATSDAVLIGAGTARADNPRLDVREGHETPRPPVRIVADPGLSLPLTGHLAETAGTQPLWLLHAAHDHDPARAEALRGIGARLLPVPRDARGALELPAALRALGDAGLTSVLCEGGGRLAAGLIQTGLVDELILITAGKVIGAEGVPSVGPLALTDLGAAPRFHPVEHRLLGEDVLTRWEPRPQG
ncbi:bifunctional diaminohydroxyphosphoribosylaminopyrimidine deaminase/5-amino-6-(5-phosphoribosylamino)uracil reductase RibD [Rhodobacteraceae bacterium 2CG4]|uniref:Riboflavin biosynthesis protein RibD n=2 Tax=Halovulum marinum TaxID=2662447 RepID=A0A6L5YYT0_9RHOB|nr:bifunctional diaminohydroxyphosphoribosylaminopyrimidine deaminase/5-amino-6-(5-phosphoribosylamino)uracil reductase RibD [Halovulum marinum]